MAKKQAKRNPASYYIDYENVRGAGLNGVEALHKGDRVVVLYGSKDSALKLQQVQNVLNSPAKVEFVKVATGKHDALDFQLVALMFMNMKKKRDYYIISKDTGFDFAIRMAKARGMERVFRRETISGAKLEPKKLPQPKETQAPKRLPNPKKTRALQSQAKTQAAPAKPEADVKAEAPSAAAAEQPTPPQPQLPAEQKPQSRRRRRKPSAATPRPPKDQYRLDIERILAKHLGGLPNAKRVEIVLAALEKSDTKSRFYNFLRGNMGNEQGREFYNELKGCFEDMKAVEKPAEPQAPQAQAEPAAQPTPAE
jgi:hypothetical protein